MIFVKKLVDRMNALDNTASTLWNQFMNYSSPNKNKTYFEGTLKMCKYEQWL